MKVGKYTIPEIRKFLVALAGAVGILLTSFLEEFTGIIPASWTAPITVVIGAVAAIAVFLTKNATVIDSISERLGRRVIAQAIESEQVVVDADGYRSIRIHTPEEYAQMAYDALITSGYRVIPAESVTQQK